ncbi:hypothetical protein Tco_1325168 [Tanacetum coccineum]
MARIEEQLDQFVDQFADRVHGMMNPRRHGDRNGQSSKGEESENPFFKGDSSSYNEQPDRPMTLFAEPIIWDIGDEEEEYQEESMPDYDTDIEDVIEEEGGFDGEENSIEDVVVVANDNYSSMIQTTLSVDF